MNYNSSDIALQIIEFVLNRLVIHPLSVIFLHRATVQLFIFGRVLGHFLQPIR